jgi:L-cysteine S-thiosulfotransferase
MNELISPVAMRRILTPFFGVHSLDCQAMPFVLWNVYISANEIIDTTLGTML